MNFLKEIFEIHDIHLTEKQCEQFDKYFHFLVDTNKKMNMTAITNEKEVVIKHFLDSVFPYEEIPNDAKVVDIGSGAGFPALPLKILRPDIEICMVDSLNKRVNFLNETISLLKISNATAIHSRVEDFAKRNREQFDIAVARAVAPLNTLVEYILPLVRIGGLAIMYKASKLEEELENAEKAIDILGGKVKKVLNFNIVEEEIERRILIIEKIKSSPSKFPRDKNKPRLEPIT